MSPIGFALGVVLAAALAATAVALDLPADDWGDSPDNYASEYATSKAVCRSVKDREPPIADRPDARTAAELRGCDSEALYYGIGIMADPVRARSCAFTETTGGGAPDHPFAGRAMLMTIYANGIGARRDLDVATRLACGVEGAPFESHFRVTHLAKLKATRWTGRDFHYCDDITSGLAGSYCAAHEARIAEPRRRAVLDALAARWTGPQKRALAALEAAQSAFADAHVTGEMDRSGTLRVALAIAWEEQMSDGLVDKLRMLAAGRAPRFTAAQFRQADAALNVAYGKIQRGALDEDWGPTKDGVRQAQRAWLRYRDAFAALIRARLPTVPHHSAMTWLTRERTAMLAELDPAGA